MSVGITVLPARSMILASPACAMISAVVPTATIVPPRIAMACATVLRPSTVMTVPSISARSTRGCASAALATTSARATGILRVTIARLANQPFLTQLLGNRWRDLGKHLAARLDALHLRVHGVDRRRTARLVQLRQDVSVALDGRE